MPSYTYEERTRILARAREQVEDIALSESLDDVVWGKTYAAGYFAALEAVGAIDKSEATELARAVEQAERDAEDRLEPGE
ncbi:hypothetical protein HKK52_19555 [Pseudomonas sp. ADAK2]|uniref:hypothetical protein n=1 Tax=unclassified Pseudomonas TaxID=196821 RepID=UPI0014636742|nr:MULTISPECIES: hypothetical protein [unclassified Pseudomonas]QJI43048.1 hypothetical protein HKK53_19560 [Pseudomonas sp. ADAK7]QJI49351.1 hypothetical protein HKK52_19555 [Pseudomonas sp. ADAK2]